MVSWIESLLRTCGTSGFFSGCTHVLLSALLLPATSIAQVQPTYEWNLRPEHFVGEKVNAVVGSVDAVVIGDVRHSQAAPAALLLDGKARHQVELTSDIGAIRLPERNISVEAWVQVDKSLEWGGICSLIQDNGNYERGWMLGYRNSNFCFGISSDGKKRLTYLTSPQPFEMGFWYHVVGTYDGAEMNLYVDGKRKASSKVQSGNIAYPQAAQFSIGCYVDDDECHPLTGAIEQVSVFDASLTHDEVCVRFDTRKAEFPGISALVPEVTDWPTYRRDNQRTATSNAKLQFPLYLQWIHRSRNPPQPAWPPPAENDFWNRKHNLQPRVTFDRANHSVCVGDVLCFGSTSDDKVYCLDAFTGLEKWTFFTEGPVRLAPTIAGNRVLFGSDDGAVYCVDAVDGKQLWKYRHDVYGDRRIPGNERIISAMPVRSSVLVEHNVAYFSAGVFPNQGVYQVAVDVLTGQLLGSGQIGVSAQGYLERRSGRLFVPGARDPAGTFAAQLVRSGKGTEQDANAFADEYPFSCIAANNVRFAGGDGIVAAVDANDGTKLWTAKVEGKAYGLSIANERLYVNTDRGLIYCFGCESVSPSLNTNQAVGTFRFSSQRKHSELKTTVQRILSESRVQKGYCLVLNSGDGGLAYEVARQSALNVVAVDSDVERVKQSRANLDAAGLYGRRVAVHHLKTEDSLPYTDYVFNLVIDGRFSEVAASGQYPPQVNRDEVMRVLRPGNGIAWMGSRLEDVVRRPSLDGIGEWSHMYADVANTSCSTDERVKGRMALQWFGKPGPRNMLNRHHRTVAPLWKNGRLFIPGNDQVFSVDAYNGTLLWNKPLPESRRIAAFRDCSYMAASDNYLFAVAADECQVLNAETGYTEHVFQVPKRSNRSVSDWGYIANVQDLLIGSGCRKGASRREHTRDSIMEASYFDAQFVVCSDYLFAFDHVTTDRQWVYESIAGAIVNSTITIGAETIFFIESKNAETLKADNGRSKPHDLMANGASVVALDLRTGKPKWRVDSGLLSAQHNLYVAFSAGKLISVGSRNSGNDKKAAHVIYDIETLNAVNGQTLWQHEQVQETKIGGDHGEQDLHPVIVGNTLYCEPMAYNIATGQRLDWGWKLGKRSGCGSISASASTFFFRQNNPTAFDLQSGGLTPVTTSTRPGCLINIIPAGGLLLIPEASSGCTCNYGVQTSLAFLPITD